LEHQEEKPRSPKGRTLVVKIIFNKPDDVAFNTLSSNDILEDLSKTIRERYFWFLEPELDVIWCADTWEP